VTQQLILACLLISAVVGAGAAITRASLFMWRALGKMVRLSDDLTGEPATGSNPARPGVLDRLASIEGRLDLLDGIESRLAALEARVHAVPDEPHL
jgi:hypothetical protein